MIVNECADHPVGYHQCDRADRNMKRAIDAERRREEAWHDRQAALLLLHDNGAEVDDAKLAAMGNELVRERQLGHAAAEAGRIFRRKVVTEIIGTQDALEAGIAPERLLVPLLKELNRLAEKFKKEFA